jgi:hypothetical protein
MVFWNISERRRVRLCPEMGHPWLVAMGSVLSGKKSGRALSFVTRHLLQPYKDSVDPS